MVLHGLLWGQLYFFYYYYYYGSIAHSWALAAFSVS
jgi:hypothetical protein